MRQDTRAWFEIDRTLHNFIVFLHWLSTPRELRFEAAWDELAEQHRLATSLYWDAVAEWHAGLEHTGITHR